MRGVARAEGGVAREVAARSRAGAVPGAGGGLPRALQLHICIDTNICVCITDTQWCCSTGNNRKYL